LQDNNRQTLTHQQCNSRDGLFRRVANHDSLSDWRLPRGVQQEHRRWWDINTTCTPNESEHATQTPCTIEGTTFTPNRSKNKHAFKGLACRKRVAAAYWPKQHAFGYTRLSRARLATATAKSSPIGGKKFKKVCGTHTHTHTHTHGVGDSYMSQDVLEVLKTQRQRAGHECSRRHCIPSQHE
jgi:hypothetical protein